MFLTACSTRSAPLRRIRADVQGVHGVTGVTGVRAANRGGDEVR